MKFRDYANTLMEILKSHPHLGSLDVVHAGDFIKEETLRNGYINIDRELKNIHEIKKSKV